MKNVYQLIQLCRKQTENEEHSFAAGIKDEEFVQFLNDAQNNIQASITKQHPRVFIEEAVLDVVSGKEKYDIPSDCFLDNKVFNVEYSPTGKEEDYYVLTEDILKYRSSGLDGSPTKYIRLSGKLLLSPIPYTGGKLRINYVKALPTLALPLGRVTSTNGKFIYFSREAMPYTVTVDSFLYENMFSICDIFGKVLKSNIIIADESLDSGTDSIRTNTYIKTTENLSSSVDYTYKGNFLLPGNNSTYVSNLDESIERYLISYCNWKILKRDSSVDSSEAMQELQLMAQEIVSSYANISDDIQLIPQLNNWDDWSV